jgi:hypothetical protein
MGRLRLKNAALSLILLVGALPVLGQESQPTTNNSQTNQQNQSPASKPNSVINSAQQLAAQASGARQNAQIPPTDAQSSINKMNATCKSADPPPNTPVLSAAPDSAASSPACDPSSLTPPFGRRTDGDVAFDALLGDTVERGTGVPTDAVGLYQDAGTQAGAAALNAAGNATDSAFLSKTAEFVASDAFSGFLGVSLASSQAGYDPPFDAMTPEQYQAYQQNQFQRLQSNLYIQNPGAFCLLNPNDARCGGQGSAAQLSDAGYGAACTQFQNAVSQYSAGTQSAQVNSLLQWCQQHGQSTGPAPQAAGGSAGSTQQGRATTTAPPPKKTTSASCGHPVCTAP